MEHFRPMAGDDLPYQTELYRDVPTPWRLADAMEYAFETFEISLRCPGFDAARKRLVEAFDHACAEREINAASYAAFFDKLVIAIMAGADRFERYIDAYGGDLAMPDAGRTERTIYDTLEEDDGRSRQENIDVPADDPDNEEPAFATTGSSDGKKMKTGTETRVFSSDGLKPGYEFLNSWYAAFKTLEEKFIEMFDPCFIYAEAWRVRP